MQDSHLLDQLTWIPLRFSMSLSKNQVSILDPLYMDSWEKDVYIRDLLKLKGLLTKIIVDKYLVIDDIPKLDDEDFMYRISLSWVILEHPWGLKEYLLPFVPKVKDFRRADQTFSRMLEIARKDIRKDGSVDTILLDYMLEDSPNKTIDTFFSIKNIPTLVEC